MNFLETLPEGIYEQYILKYIKERNQQDINTLYSLIQLNWWFYNNTIQEYSCIKRGLSYMMTNFINAPKKIHMLFGKSNIKLYKKIDPNKWISWIRKNEEIFVSNVIFYPILRHEPHFTGGTSYIDGIKVSDVTYPIMIGIDYHGRKFITFKLNYKKKNGKSIQLVSTLFQRYSDSENTWVFGTYMNKDCKIGNRTLHGQTLLNEEDLIKYRKVIDGESVENDCYIISLCK